MAGCAGSGLPVSSIRPSLASSTMAMTSTTMPVGGRPNTVLAPPGALWAIHTTVTAIAWTAVSVSSMSAV
jgi:hypothetical protein